MDNGYETYYSTDDHVTTGHIEVDLVKSMDIDGVIIQEYIPLGQRIGNIGSKSGTVLHGAEQFQEPR